MGSVRFDSNFWNLSIFITFLVGLTQGSLRPAGGQTPFFGPAVLFPDHLPPCK